MDNSRRLIYEFGPFRLDSVRRLLLRHETPVPLTAKNFDLLLTLVQRRGQLLTKEALLSTIWPQLVVEEGNLTQNIFVLRKILGETPTDHRYIVTVPGRGYRFVAPVYEYEERQRPEWAGDAAHASGQAIAVAVLPFKNINPQTDETYLGQGLASSLINRLNRLRSIVARPTTSVLKYTDPGYTAQAAGRELGVGIVLDGTIQSTGESIRVNVELVRVGDGAVLWAGQFDNSFTDIFSTQDRIAEQVVGALQVGLTGDEHSKLVRQETDNCQAYRLYIKGRFFWDQRTRGGLLKAAEYAQRAISFDPGYVRAYVGLADSYLLLGQYLHLSPAEAFPRAREAALRALELDESCAGAHASLAEVYFFHGWDWARAEAAYRRACELDPRYATARHWYAWFLMTQRRFDEAVEQISLAQRLDPGSLALAVALGMPHYYRRGYGSALEQYQEVLEMNPDYALAHYYRGLSCLHLGRFDEAVSSLRKVKAVDYQQQVTAQLGYAYARVGRHDDALKMLSELRRMKSRQYVSPYTEAFIYAGLDERGEALTLLEEAFAGRAPWTVFLQVEPCFDSLRTEPRFRRLLRELWG